MSKGIEVYPCGITAHTKLSKIEGMITAHIERFGKIEYEFSYFDGLERKSIWIAEAEFTTDDKKQKIGFK
jgi:hypothetical protein